MIADGTLYLRFFLLLPGTDDDGRKVFMLRPGMRKNSISRHSTGNFWRTVS